MHNQKQTLKMSKQNKLEDQAIMNLLYLGQDQQQPSFADNFAQYQSKGLCEARHKFKSNIIHLRNAKNTFNTTQTLPTTKLHPQQHRYQPSKNKENLKKILEKLENSPSPSQKVAKSNQKTMICRVNTQKSQQVSKSKQKLKFKENRTPKISKKQLDKLFNKKNDKQFIKSLIKAKIVQKLKKIEHKKSENKASCPITLLDQIGDSRKRFQKQRVVTLRSEQSIEKTKYTNLLRQQHFINASLFSRKNSQINLKRLLF